MCGLILKPSVLPAKPREPLLYFEGLMQNFLSLAPLDGGYIMWNYQSNSRLLGNKLQVHSVLFTLLRYFCIRGSPTCVHESLQVQCIDVIAVSCDNAWPQCTELVVIRARMSDLLCFCIYTILETTPLLLKRKGLESCSVESCPFVMQLHVMRKVWVILLQPREQTISDVLILEADIFCASAWAVAHDYL